MIEVVKNYGRIICIEIAGMEEEYNQKKEIGVLL